jgi:xylem cysteine proteinase
MLFFLFVSAALSLEYTGESNVELVFSSWMKEHKKVYASNEETIKRYNIFKTNLAWINQRNTELTHMTVGLNEFADETEEEFAAYRLHPMDVEAYNASIMKYTTPAPTNDPQVTGKCATSVVNQGQCGSCWAFSASGAAEGLLCLPSLDGENAYGHVAPQELVDCACSGCNGGWPHTALDYFASNGWCHESEYRYTARKGSCQSSKCKGSGISGHSNVQEPNLVSAISSNMLSICIDAGGLDFMFYKDGMYAQDMVTCSKHSVNHAVLAVGGSSSSYHVKNSWGSSWGQSGYFDMPANKNCLGVNNQASVYPRK